MVFCCVYASWQHANKDFVRKKLDFFKQNFWWIHVDSKYQALEKQWGRSLLRTCPVLLCALETNSALGQFYVLFCFSTFVSFYSEPVTVKHWFYAQIIKVRGKFLNSVQKQQQQKETGYGCGENIAKNFFCSSRWFYYLNIPPI